MGTIAFCILSGPYTFQGAHTLVKLANAALEKGHQIAGIFFFVDGVYNVKKGIKVEPGSMDIPVEIQALAEKGVKIAVCPACSEYRGITEADMVKGAELGGLALFSEFIEASNKLIVFGM